MEKIEIPLHSLFEPPGERDQRWREKALCVEAVRGHDSDYNPWFADDGKQEEAIQICRQCSVSDECLRTEVTYQATQHDHFIEVGSVACGGMRGNELFAIFRPVLQEFEKMVNALPKQDKKTMDKAYEILQSSSVETRDYILKMKYDKKFKEQLQFVKVRKLEKIGGAYKNTNKHTPEATKATRDCIKSMRQKWNKAFGV